jgi:hypothetical protein
VKRSEAFQPWKEAFLTSKKTYGELSSDSSAEIFATAKCHKEIDNIVSKTRDCYRSSCSNINNIDGQGKNSIMPTFFMSEEEKTYFRTSSKDKSLEDYEKKKQKKGDASSVFCCIL